MKKKGFTLVELLAVIVILAIIAVIAVPIVLNVISKSKKGAAIDSAYSYVDAIEKYIVMHDMDETKYPINLESGETYQVSNTTYTETSSINLIEKVYAEDSIILNDIISIKGTKPSKGIVTISEKRKVGKAILVIDSYKVICETGKCNIDGEVANVEEPIQQPEPAKVTLSGVVQLGDYVKMTPTLTEYTFTTGTDDGIITGCNDSACPKTQTINPSELNIWRVIGINTEAGTIEMVSEYVSSVGVSFYGATGANNSVGTLNTIVKNAYGNTKYTVTPSADDKYSMRNIGYDGQTEYNYGLSDSKYTTDTNKLANANIQLKAYGVEVETKGDTGTVYWLASRHSAYCWVPDDTRYIRYVGETGSIGSFQSNELISRTERTMSGRLRPIITLKQGVKVSTGDGKSEDTAWVVD